MHSFQLHKSMHLQQMTLTLEIHDKQVVHTQILKSFGKQRKIPQAASSRAAETRDLQQLVSWVLGISFQTALTSVL